MSGELIGILGVGASLAVLILSLVAWLRGDIRDVRSDVRGDVRDVRNHVQGVDRRVARLEGYFDSPWPPASDVPPAKESKPNGSS